MVAHTSRPARLCPVFRLVLVHVRRYIRALSSLSPTIIALIWFHGRLVSVPSSIMTPHVAQCVLFREKLVICLVCSIREQPSQQITRMTDTYRVFFPKNVFFSKMSRYVSYHIDTCLSKIVLTTHFTDTYMYGTIHIWLSRMKDVTCPLCIVP